jgi:hypothetical protein
MNRETQRRVVLKHLRRATITRWDAISKYRITNLPGRIYDLRKAGHFIKARRVQEGRTHYARYLLVH